MSELDFKYVVGGYFFDDTFAAYPLIVYTSVPKNIDTGSSSEILNPTSSLYNITVSNTTTGVIGTTNYNNLAGDGYALPVVPTTLCIMPGFQIVIYESTNLGGSYVSYYNTSNQLPSVIQFEKDVNGLYGDINIISSSSSYDPFQNIQSCVVSNNKNYNYDTLGWLVSKPQFNDISYPLVGNYNVSSTMNMPYLQYQTIGCNGTTTPTGWINLDNSDSYWILNANMSLSTWAYSNYSANSDGSNSGNDADGFYNSEGSAVFVESSTKNDTDSFILTYNYPGNQYQVGGYMINTDHWLIPILYSTANLNGYMGATFQIWSADDTYIIMPGFCLYIYSGTSYGTNGDYYPQIINNTYGLIAVYLKTNYVNQANSWMLYYKNQVVNYGDFTAG